jgi:hypothetical protein
MLLQPAADGQHIQCRPLLLRQAPRIQLLPHLVSQGCRAAQHQDGFKDAATHTKQ